MTCLGLFFFDFFLPCLASPGPLKRWFKTPCHKGQNQFPHNKLLMLQSKSNCLFARHTDVAQFTDRGLQAGRGRHILCPAEGHVLGVLQKPKYGKGVKGPRFPVASLSVNRSKNTIKKPLRSLPFSLHLDFFAYDEG